MRFRLDIWTLVGVCAAIGISSLGASAGANDQWPQWRGPHNNGVSAEQGLPTEFSATENVAWRLPLPGPAGSTPVIWGERIFLTSAKDQDLVGMCVSTDGNVLWERLLATGDEPVRGDEGNFASPSPVTDGKHVWFYMGEGTLACFDLNGGEVWKFNMQDRYGKFKISFGMTSTPVLDGDRLYLQCLHSNAKLVVCLDKFTGAQVWKHERISDARAECEHSYASPILYRDAQREFLVTHGADYVVAHRLTDGSEIFRCGGINPPGTYNPTLRLVASPAAVEGLIVVPSAKNGPVLGIDPAAQGDISATGAGLLWKRPDNTPDVPSPLIHEGLVYLCRENGNVLCLDAKSGAEIYAERGHQARHRASPVYADGKVYLSARDGVVTVLKAGPKFEVLAKNELGEDLSSSPVVHGGSLYLRSYNALYRITDGARAMADDANAAGDDSQSATGRPFPSEPQRHGE